MSSNVGCRNNLLFCFKGFRWTWKDHVLKLPGKISNQGLDEMAEVGSAIRRSPINLNFVQIFSYVFTNLVDEVFLSGSQGTAAAIKLKFREPDTDG